MSDPGVIARAKEAELAHQVILNTLGEAESAERMREIAGQLAVLKREYVARELFGFQLLTPSALDPLNPDHAIVLAVRDDLRQTEAMIENNLAQKRLWEQSKTAPSGFSPFTGGGNADDFWKRMKEFLDGLGSVGKWVVVGLAIYLGRDIVSVFKKRGGE